MSALTLDTTEVTYTFRPTEQAGHFTFDGVEVIAVDVRCYVVADDGDPYLWVDVTTYGYVLTKKGERDGRRGHGPLHLSAWAGGYLDDRTPSRLLTDWIGPAVRDVILPRHPEFAGLSISGFGPMDEWLAANPA